MKQETNPLAVLGTINDDNQPTVGRRDLIKRMKKTANFSGKKLGSFRQLGYLSNTIKS